MSRPPPEPDGRDDLRMEVLGLRAAVHDRTTGLPSYLFLVDPIRSLLDSCRRIGVLHVGIANLEPLESLYGWQVFDRVMTRLAGALRVSAREDLPEGALLAIDRIAGDRFVAFVPGPGGKPVTADLLRDVARAVRRRLEAAFEDEAFREIAPAPSFRTGHALLTDDPFFRLERRIHAAVEEARSQDERQEARRARARQAELRRILRDASISTVFQPVIDLDTGDPIGYEALARGPKDSALEMPATLFATSARLGISADLDRLCRNVAIRAAAEVVRAAGTKIFLNALPASLADAGWTEGTVAEELERVAISRNDLVIEVSERTADGDLETLSRACGLLRQRGFEVALDDVGTGYASLATASRLQPRWLKLSPGIVRGISLSPIQRSVVSSILAVARQVEADVVAVGVETDADADALRSTGARYAQGFLFAGPSAAAPRPQGTPAER